LSHGLERVLVDVVHVIGEGVPRRSERALGAVGVVGNDIDTGYLGHLIHGHMVVGDHASRLLGEVRPVAGLARRAPNLLHNLGGILHGQALLIELCALSAHHIEQYAVSWSEALRQIGREMLRAECP